MVYRHHSLRLVPPGVELLFAHTAPESPGTEITRIVALLTADILSCRWFHRNDRYLQILICRLAGFGGHASKKRPGPLE
jgi:hypothetical protein